ncbi:CRISPR-associated protein Csb2 [Haloactinospora alba]|uniref:CRISPR-associated protein Csb2 n=1 Tax=Haloactinospora alba TaxID=405555 RepID=A0A543NFD9_9ACTN|nr:type I-U CRISPR-associated protein Csb2 [Haloactinospora alba]TQN30555.1 CRISPR-associated protein Csb2 [Haloactinospora alba]
MALVIETRLLTGRYEAATPRGDRAEWPPHPARLFNALVAAARGDSEREALRWLEQQPPPQVWAPPLEEETTAAGYVVTNKTARKGGHHWPGRTAVERSRTTGMPTGDTFAVVWEDADPPQRTAEVLGELAWNVPYLGRASNPAALRVHTTPTPRDGWETYTPARLDTPGAAELRVCYPGYLDALDAAFAEGRRAWEESRTVPYVRQAEATDPTETPASAGGPFTTMLAFSLPPRTVRPEGTELLRVTSALRDTVLSLLGDDAASQITGHTTPGRGHVAYLGLPNVGHEKAQGHILGAGLLLPRDLDHDAAAQLRRALADPQRNIQVRMGRAGRLDLTYEPWPSRPSRLTPAYWSAGRAGTRHWTTATPVMLDRYTRRNSDLAHHVARCLTTAGYPEPAGVTVSDSPLLAGAPQRPAAGTFPPDRPRRKLLHARVAFAEPVHGPVVAGSLRYLGLGLFAPTGPPTANTTDHGEDT